MGQSRTSAISTLADAVTFYTMAGELAEFGPKATMNSLTDAQREHVLKVVEENRSLILDSALTAAMLAYQSLGFEAPK